MKKLLGIGLGVIILLGSVQPAHARADRKTILIMSTTVGVAANLFSRDYNVYGICGFVLPTCCALNLFGEGGAEYVVTGYALGATLIKTVRCMVCCAWERLHRRFCGSGAHE